MKHVPGSRLVILVLSVIWLVSLAAAATADDWGKIGQNLGQQACKATCKEAKRSCALDCDSSFSYPSDVEQCHLACKGAKKLCTDLCNEI